MKVKFFFLILLVAFYSSSQAQSLQQQHSAQSESQEQDFARNHLKMKSADIVLSCELLRVYAIHGNQLSIFKEWGLNKNGRIYNLRSQTPSMSKKIHFNPNDRSYSWTEIDDPIPGFSGDSNKILTEYNLLLNERVIYFKSSMDNRVVKFPCKDITSAFKY